MFKHTTDEVVMIRPHKFYFNAETAVNNAYQQNDGMEADKINEKAVLEFDNLVKMMKDKGIKVHVLNDTAQPSTPDSIFPNNWFSTHEEGQFVIYPMFAVNRQAEVDKHLKDVHKIVMDRQKSAASLTTFDYRDNIGKKKFLEGTGSIVIDRTNRTAYCTLSPRADEELFLKWAEDTGHKPVVFRAFQDNVEIYHTNVLMGIGPVNAIVCLESIAEGQRDMVRKALEDGGKTVVDISLDQVKKFLGNTLELKGKDRSVICMSTTAFDSLTPEQKAQIEKESDILAADISTIEFYGGGSVRCMIAEIF